MSDSKPEWDALIPLLYKEFWAENEAIYILAGIKPNESKTSFTRLRTGKHVPASEAKYLYKHIFDSWTGDSHPWTEGILYSASYTSWNSYNKYYFLHWVAQKPFIEVEWLDWAYSEGHLKEDEKRRIAKLIDGKVTSIVTKAKPDDESKGYDNLLRLTGVLREMLADPKVIEQLRKDPESFKITGELANYIGHEYGSQECFNNKGLSKKSCNDRFAEAKKILNNDRL